VQVNAPAPTNYGSTQQQVGGIGPGGPAGPLAGSSVNYGTVDQNNQRGASLGGGWAGNVAMSEPGNANAYGPNIANTPEYQTYANMTGIAGGYGAAGAPYVQGAGQVGGQLGQYGSAAYGSAMGNTQSQQQNRQALGYLQQQAAGQAPSAAQLQMQQGYQQALANAQAQAGSTRGNLGLAGAEKGAMGQATQAGQQTNAATAQLRAQEMAGAQTAYAQETNQAAIQQAQAIQNYGQYAQQQQQLGLGYQTGQEQFYGQEGANAGTMAVAQGGIGQGLSGYATQQNIANQQQQTQLAGAGIGAAGSFLGALALAA
jgi:hypothetical protein